MKRLSNKLDAVALAILLSSVAGWSFAAGPGVHWTYTGPTGPTKWGGLEKAFATCKLGKVQSPIDIRDNAVHQADLAAINFDYKPSTLRIIDDGHTIQVNYDPGSLMSVGGKQYDLVQFHFHKPSEEKLNGKAYDRDAHLVHKDKDGNLAVVAVLMHKGHDNPFIKTLWDNLPTEKEKESVVDKVRIDVSELLPEHKAYYTFAGSLTTPPCSEGVTWFVLKSPVQVSTQEIRRFAKASPMNARPVQPLNGRVIQESK